ncbi:MAG: MmcQ/YjbR family DNA-binding protein [Jatrophihabitans sp.]
MDSAAALAYALAKPGAWADDPWQEHREVAKVASKIFLFPGADDGHHTITVKNTAEAVDELKQRYPTAAGPARYLNKRLWVRLVIDEVPADEVHELIDDSYELVVATLPRSVRPG